MQEAQDIKNDQIEQSAELKVASDAAAARMLPVGFVFIEVIGEGGASVVSKAFEPRLQQTVAIKVLKDCDSPETDLSRKLMRESRAIAKLDHPNIVKLFQVGYAPSGAPYLVYEFLSGLTLEQAMENTTLHPQEIFVIFDEILKGLSHIHAAGLVHRDIKPSNIILTKGTNTTAGAFSGVKILDFGIAKEAFAEDDPTATTSSGSLVGSPPYMSPEQCQRSKLDARSDLYAVACMLYEALSKRRVFSGNTPMDIMYKQIHEAPPPLPDLGGGNAFQSAFSALIFKTLSKNRDDRPADASTFRKLLEEAAALHTEAVPSRVQVPTPKLSKPMLLAGAFLSALLILAYGYIRVQQSESLTKKEDPWKKTSLQALSISTKIKAIAYDIYTAEKRSKKSPQEADLFLGRLESLTKQLKAPADKFAVHFLKAKLYEWTGQFEKVIDEKKQALAFCRRPDGTFTIEAGDCYHEIGKFLFEMGKFEEAKVYFLKAIEIVQARDENVDNVHSLSIPMDYHARIGADFEHRNNDYLAKIYRREGDLKNARIHYSRIFDRFDRFNRLSDYVESRLDLASIIAIQDGPKAAQDFLADYEDRLVHYKLVDNESLRGFDMMVAFCKKNHWDKLAAEFQSHRPAYAERVKFRDELIRKQAK